MKKKLLFILAIVFNLCFFSPTLAQDISGRGCVHTDNYANINLEYYYYIPSSVKNSSSKAAPFLVMVPGLSGDGEGFVSPEFRNFAQQYGFVIIAPSFREDSANFEKCQSYQYPAAWSGKAFNQILNDFIDKQHIISQGLYMFGFSAGAQFVERYSLLYPNYVTACMPNAPGSVTLPESYKKTKFFIAVGAQDEDFRRKAAIDFYNKAKSLGINVKYKQYNVGHGLSAEQINDGIEFFKSVRYGR